MSSPAGKYSVTIYCPDSHLTYDRHILDSKGVGGGATTRVRIAYALAARGHRVQLYINCPKETIESGVETYHFSKLKKDHSDIFIASTSGGQFDLATLAKVEIESKLKIILVHGIAQPNNLSSYPFDFGYVPSNFIRGKLVNEWGITPEKILTTNRGIQESHFAGHVWRVPRRNPFSLLYAGHPSKGLETSIAILRSLRKVEPRFHLHVYAGAGLWGETGEDPLEEAGVTFHGIIGQRQLAREMQQFTFSMNLQAIRESFGLSIIDAMRAGCIALASPVGAYPEIVIHGQNGFLVPGDHTQEPARRAAVDIILALTRNPDYVDYLRRNAIHTPLTWDTVARTWEGHWNWFFTGKQPPGTAGLGACNECQGAWLPLADGLHCINCGHYQSKSSSTQ